MTLFVKDFEIVRNDFHDIYKWQLKAIDLNGCFHPSHGDILTSLLSSVIHVHPPYSVRSANDKVVMPL
jgi:hypothetical protein